VSLTTLPSAMLVASLREEVSIGELRNSLLAERLKGRSLFMDSG